MKVQEIHTPQLGDHRGALVSYEWENHVPFDIKRVYFIFGNDDAVVRGKHAHKKLEQMITCIQGKCTLRLDNGQEEETILLEDPCHGIIIPPEYWHDLSNFTSDTVLAVFCDDVYDEGDYLRTYEQFLAYHVKG